MNLKWIRKRDRVVYPSEHFMIIKLEDDEVDYHVEVYQGNIDIWRRKSQDKWSSLKSSRQEVLEKVLENQEVRKRVVSEMI